VRARLTECACKPRARWWAVGVSLCAGDKAAPVLAWLLSVCGRCERHKAAAAAAAPAPLARSLAFSPFASRQPSLARRAAATTNRLANQR